MKKRFALAFISAAAIITSCKDRSPPAPEPSAREAAPALAAREARPPLTTAERMSPEGMLAEAARYVDDARFRRETLTASLVNAKNTYSRHRLDAYGLGSHGWDLLPEWNPQSLPVTTTTAEALRHGEAPVVAKDTPRLWDGKRPTTQGEWVALGRTVFFGYPLRSEVFMRYALEHPDLAEKVGIRPGSDGAFPGARVFVDIDGQSKIGITCAVCHANVTKNGDVIAGQARRAFDYGALRLAYHDATKTPVTADFARRMKTWGPGRADVTEDDDEDPVAIPDLWGLAKQTFLTQAGTIRQVGPAALAIRQETQLLHSNHQKVRPPRVLAYALAMFLYSLEPPSRAKTTTSAKVDADVVRGRALFEERCRGCHSNDAYGGDAIAHARVGTNPALATGTARGTGTYRPPALLDVKNAAPYFHDGSLPTLADVLDPDRAQPTYTRSPLGKGPVAGHLFGSDLGADDRRAIVGFLETL